MYVKAANVFEAKECTHLMLGISGFPTQAAAFLALEAIRGLIGKLDRARLAAARKEQGKRGRAPSDEARARWRDQKRAQRERQRDDESAEHWRLKAKEIEAERAAEAAFGERTRLAAEKFRKSTLKVTRRKGHGGRKGPR